LAEFLGGRVVPIAHPGGTLLVYAAIANLTPDSAGLRDWSYDDFEKA
jgi:hypothetical protein